MQVILLERVEKLGQMGQVVSVKAGYARNFLLPKKKESSSIWVKLTDNLKKRSQKFKQIKIIRKK